MKQTTVLIIFVIFFYLHSCAQKTEISQKEIIKQEQFQTTEIEKNFFEKLSDAALELTKDRITYDPSYFSISYPNGDVPADKGVCTDVIIRAYRKMGIDLQEKVHLDMKKNFNLYPSQKKWGLSKPDKNIDHRRVLNLQVFFSRYGNSEEITNNQKDYLPGDIVSWNLGGGLTHIGIIVDRKTRDKSRYMIVHNIGRGQVMEDCLFSWEITGHYRYDGTK